MKYRSTEQTPSAATRDEIDPVFKEVVSFRFGQLGISLHTEVEVSRMPRTIDALMVLERDEDMENVRLHTPFEHVQRWNQIEFKGVRDAPTPSGYYLILGRAYLYIGENNIPQEQMTVTIVCARKPRTLLSQLGFRALGGGHYLNSIGLTVHIIVINELPIETKNYPLLLFASSTRKFRQFLQRTLDADNLDYIRFAYHLHPQLTQEVLTMAGKYRIPKKDLEFMAKDIGPELLPFLDPEERLRGLSLEERLRGLSAEERRKLKQLLEERVTEEKEIHSR